MNISKNKNIIRICAISLTVIVVISLPLWWFFAKKPADTLTASTSPSQDSSQQQSAKYPEFNFSLDQLKEMAENIAKSKFGEDAFILLLTEDEPSLIEIDGIKRYVHTFAADSVSKNNSTDTIRGLFHIDPVTGEVFELKDGNMTKITIGE